MISIIGAGPGGAHSATLLAKNHDVKIFEEHKEVGKPVQCTGVVSKNIKDLLPTIKPFAQNKLRGAIFYSKHKRLELRTPRTQAYMICRIKLDNYLIQRSLDRGATLHKDRRFADFKKSKLRANINKVQNKKNYKKLNLRLQDSKKNNYIQETDLLIGADGPTSQVAKSSNLYDKRDFFVAVQAVVKGHFDKDMVELYLGDICPDFFAWLAPVSETEARVGLASHKLPTNPMFKKFMKVIDEKRGEKHKVLEMQGGLIPKYHKIKTQRDNVYLVGDAALQNKQATGGGIIMSLIAANCLEKSIRTGKSYQLLWEKAIRKDLEASRLIRNKLSSMSNDKYDKVLDFLSKSPSLKTLAKHGDMDFPSKFAPRMLFSDPRLVQFLF